MTATDPVERAISIAGDRHPYVLGTGDYQPQPDGVDVPWTERDGVTGSDCAGFAISWCHRMRRHRPGFNRGPWATVDDDINTDSAIEDALHKRELFEPVIVPELNLFGPVLPGDLLVYKTIVLSGHPKPWIGHVALVMYALPSFDHTRPDWTSLWVAQCCGPNGRTPAVIETDGSIWSHHDHIWGDVIARRSVVLRVKHLS